MNKRECYQTSVQVTDCVMVAMVMVAAVMVCRGLSGLYCMRSVSTLPMMKIHAAVSRT